MITIILAGRNDDYGRDFRGRLFRAAGHNAALLSSAGVHFEYLLAEWNPLPDKALLAEEFVRRIPEARAIVIPQEIDHAYSLNPHMPFHEMAAKNAALRRALGEIVIVTNADILFGEQVVRRITARNWKPDTLYRAHRIDVSGDLTWEQMKDPANQLPSGEGRENPCYYMGAGGDFCLAPRTLWMDLRGFNEAVRFSTRAKDWQFFLSAAARGVGIEFIGDVYHMDHQGGFRNTPTEQRNAETVHYGGWWDIEFGLPVSNPDSWGFGELEEVACAGEPKIRILDGRDYSFPEAQERRDLEIRAWLTHPAGEPDLDSAILFHTICAAQKQGVRLICRVQEERTLVALSGMLPIAREFSVPIFCSRNLPPMPGFTAHPFPPEPTEPWDADWVLEDAGSEFTWRNTGAAGRSTSFLQSGQSGVLSLIPS